MSVTILNEIRDELITCGAVRGETEFCVGWLGRGAGYMRTLRFVNQTPSAVALATLASKLGHYGERLGRGDEAQRAWAKRFERMQARCQTVLEQQARERWETQERMSYGA